MAVKDSAKETTAQTEGAAERKKTAVRQDAVYSAEELAADADKVFGTRRECVLAAMKDAGMERCTVSEAKAIVEGFLNREVG